jgi:hypothetical protein
MGILYFWIMDSSPGRLQTLEVIDGREVLRDPGIGAGDNLPVELDHVLAQRGGISREGVERTPRFGLSSTFTNMFICNVGARDRARIG